MLALSALAIIVGAFVPLPGLDYDAIRAFEPAILPPFGVVGESVAWLATVHFVLIAAKWDAKPAARRIAFVIYLVVVAIQGIGIALFLESLNGVAMFDVVDEPGWAFRLRSSLIWSAGGSLVWYLAARIDATGRAHGALFLLLIRVGFDYATRGFDVGRAFGQGTSEGSLAAWLLVPLAVALVGAAIAIRPPVWPVTFRDRAMRSWWDALALVALAVIPGSFASSLAMWSGDVVEWAWVDELLAFAIAIPTVVWWWRLEDEGEREVAPAIFGAVFVVGSLVPAMLGYVESGGFERAMAPAPLAGNASFTLVLRAEGGSFQPSDPQAMITRLDRLGARAEVTDRTPGVIRLEVHDAIGPDEVLEALQPHHFELRMVVETRELECAAVDESRPLQATGCEFRPEMFPLEPGRCAFHCLEPEVRLSTGDVEDASVVVDEWGVAVAATLRGDAAERFADLTAANVDRKLAIVVDDTVVSAPVIRSRIGGGRIQISLGQGPDVLVEAEALAAALQPGAEIRTRWTYEAIE